jgi:hypothetical protein
MVELTELRTSHSKTFDKGNGSKVVECSVARVHYLENGEYLDIDTNWEYENGFGHKVQKADYHLRHYDHKVRFGFSNGVFVDYGLNYAFNFHENVADTEADSNTQIRYKAIPDGVKLEIELAECPALPPSYSYSADTTNCSIIVDNNKLIFIDKDDVPIGEIPSPWMVDANGERGDVTIDYVDGNIVFTPDFAFLQAAAYPVTIDPTTTLQVGADADDGFWATDNFFGTNYGVMMVGTLGDTTSRHMFSRFSNVTIPQGATILSSKIQYKADGNYSNTSCITRIYLNNVDNASAPTSAVDANAKTLTTGYVDWTIGTWATNTWYDSPDIKDIVQAIVNRIGWASGYAMMILHKTVVGSSTAGAYREAYDYGYSGNISGPKLIIEYSTSVDVTIDAVTATATAEAIAPTVSTTWNATIQSVTATATAQAIAPTITAEQNATIDAPVATATSQAIAPTVINYVNSTVTKYAQSNDSGWTNSNNGHADDGSYATVVPAQNGSTYVYYRNFDFGLPADAIINQITVEQQWKVSTTSSIATLRSRAYLGTTAMGTEYTNTAEPTSDTTQSYTNVGTFTVAQLNDNSASGFRVRIGASRGNTATSFTGSLDYVKVSVAYSVPITAVVATATAEAPAPTVVVVQNATVQSVVANANAEAIPPSVLATQNTTIQSVVANANAAAIPPTVTATISCYIDVPTAECTALALRPTISLSTTINAVVATATSDFKPPLAFSYQGITLELIRFIIKT